MPGESLTLREREVLELLAAGYTNREVAERLHVSTRTAEFHRANIQGKLQLRGRAQLISFALAEGEPRSSRSG